MSDTASQDPATYRKYFFVANPQRMATILAAKDPQPTMDETAFKGAHIRVNATSEAKALEKLALISDPDMWDLHHMVEASAAVDNLQ